MDYFVLRMAVGLEGNDHAVIDSLPSKCPTEWRFFEGEPLASEFPENVALKLSRNFSTGRKLQDFVGNIIGLLIVSARAQTAIESAGVTNGEFLPVTIKDQKGKLVPQSFAILNLLGSEDAIDMKKSDVRMGAIEKTQVKAINRLVLNRQGIGRDARMFRASTMLRLVLVREDVRDALDAAGLTGYATFPADGWNGMDF
jgi:hypothetical protein